MSNPESIGSLLALEKERRGVAQSELIFIGIANVAKRDAAKARRNELEFFSDYLSSRKSYARKFGLVDALPANPAEILLVGETITYEQVEAANPLPDTLSSERLSEERLSSLRERYISKAMSLESYDQGNLAHDVFAEEYPSIKWYFPWEGRVFIALPDGLTKDSVYEFKSTTKVLYKTDRAKQATAQSDIYGLFFQRANKRVQVYCWEDGELTSVDSPVDTSAAITRLRGFCARL
jgi:hypothetical protein